MIQFSHYSLLINNIIAAPLTQIIADDEMNNKVKSN